MMHNKPMLHSTTHPTPVGTLTLVASDRGLRAVVWPKSLRKGTGVNGRPHRNPDHPILKTTARQLDEYFSGERSTFDIPLDLEGTRFQVAAWRSLAQIPFGTTTTYGRQAAGLGIPTAARAVGAANGANPVCIVLPCHRVIGSNGSLTGFGYPCRRACPCPWPDQALRQTGRGRRDRLRRPVGRGVRLPRTERRRQDVDDAHDRLRLVAVRWRASRARPRSGDRRPANPSEAGGGAPGGHARHGTPGRRKPAHLRPLLRYSA